jgi:hypothetical protein
MKKQLFTTLSLLIIIFSSCGKTDLDKIGGNSGGPVFGFDPKCKITATIDGAAYNSTDCRFDGGSYEISCANFPIMIGIQDYAGIGVYPASWGAVYKNGKSSSTTSCTVAVTATTPYVTGTFSFTCDDGTKVTDGIFIAHN